MSKLKKFYDKLSSLPTPNDISFDELKSFLLKIGFKVSSRGGSHNVFTCKNCDPISIPKKRQIKDIYIRMIIKIIKENGVEF